MSSPLEIVQAIADRHRSVPGGLLPALHAVQEALGHVPDTAVPLLAEAMNLSRAEVHGVLTYYHFFRRTPPACEVVQICRAEACQACGSEELWAYARREFGDGHQLNAAPADVAIAVEPVYCLGLCASSPAVQIGHKLHARVTPEKLDRLLAGLKEAA